MKATIKDVAREAKVSISTVSYAINGNERISEETRKRVLEVAKRLNYVANGNAKMLKQKKTRAIGLFFNSWFGPIYSEIARGIERTVHKMGYDLVACSLYGEEHSTAYKYLRDRMVDGAIVLTNSFDDQFLHSVASEDLPLVVLDREIQAPHIYSILIDNFGGAFAATKALISSGCKEVYFFSGPQDSYDNQKRLDGYIAALGYFNVEFNKDFIIPADFTEESGYQQMKALLAKGIAPRAIFSGNDEMAIGIIRAAREHGVTIPGDLRLVGFDDIRESEMTVPALTTISHQKLEMGTLAAETLFSAINGDDNIDSPKIIPTNLIKRETL
ncbi:LacI family DNA-binding transcriptional regulator [Endozoicomonas elysicola]|uniref:LacI family transcriptional regulator n=1 Tax=Endozoicomonas elysicola TaxID=305900 RepID=A0A081KBH2_9GAMM|nr:LacI family DNA-binding transcriptional regulator [Endozoicomonas elysicola]KEI71498.1 LacI family transcriptional regulator [Endozoicomonas elysicola]